MNMLQSRWFKSCGLLLAMLPSLIYLGVGASREESWDNWDFGSAQTMLTARYWGRDGFIKHKLLALPSGYHREVQVLDKPEFQFLANGIMTGGLIGRRTHYTHYPPLYLVPYGLLAKLGVESRFWFRMLSLFFSFSSVIFMAGFVYLITKRNAWVALLAVLYYATSANFLGYADSLSNTPLDDFLKWAILLLSYFIFNSAAKNGKPDKVGRIFVWIVYFILSLASYDSTFLIFFWLCGLDFFQHGKIILRKCFFWALAPVSAFILQMGQNIWYLGIKNAALDLWGTFIFRFSATPQVNAGLNALPLGIKNLLLSLTTIGYFSDMRTRFALPLVVVLAYLLFKDKFIGWEISRFTPVLAIGGLMYPLILPSTAAFGYQGRQVAPVLLLLFSLASLALWKAKKNTLIAPCLIIFLAAHFYGLFTFVGAWKSRSISKEKIDYWRQLSSITDARTMIMGGKDALDIGSNRFFDEYYSDRLILSFQNLDMSLMYIDKLYAAMPGKVNFLLVATEMEYPNALEKLKSMKEYTAIPRTIDALPQGLALISVTHKQ